MNFSLKLIGTSSCLSLEISTRQQLYVNGSQVQTSQLLLHCIMLHRIEGWVTNCDEMISNGLANGLRLY